MVRPADVVVLFALMGGPGESWTIRSLAHRLGVPHPKVQRALERLARAGLYDAHRRRLVLSAVEEFLVHALKYLDPIEEGPLARGLPTAWAAEPLRGMFADSDEAPPVWPYAYGTVRGPSVQPLDEVLPSLIKRWPEVAELAALADAVRLRDRRARELAIGLLHDRIEAVG